MSASKFELHLKGEVTLPLNVPLRGEQLFLHGPDVFNEMIRILKHRFAIHRPTHIVFKLQRLMLSKVSLTVRKSRGITETEKSLACVIGEFVADGRLYEILIRGTGIAFDQRVASQQTEILKETQILYQSSRGISIRTRKPWNTADLMVAIGNRYLENSIRKNPKHWFLTRLEFGEIPPAETDSLELRYQEFHHRNSAICALHIGGKAVGLMYGVRSQTKLFQKIDSPDSGRDKLGHDLRRIGNRDLASS